MIDDETLSRLHALPERFNLHILAKELIWRRAVMERIVRWASDLEGSDRVMSADEVAAGLRERLLP